MQTKLTLRLDDRLIAEAKKYARQSGKSVSQLVAEYFALLAAGGGNQTELTPAVRKLKGVLTEEKIDEPDYRRYLEDKYL